MNGGKRYSYADIEVDENVYKRIRKMCVYDDICNVNVLRYIHPSPACMGSRH